MWIELTPWCIVVPAILLISIAVLVVLRRME